MNVVRCSKIGALALALAVAACGGAEPTRSTRSRLVVESVAVSPEAVAIAGDLEAAAASALSAASAAGWRLAWTAPLALRLTAPGEPVTIVGVASTPETSEPDPDGAPAYGARSNTSVRAMRALEEPDPDGEPAEPSLEEPGLEEPDPDGEPAEPSLEEPGLEEPDPDGEPAGPAAGGACEPDPDGEPAESACLRARARVLLTVYRGTWRATPAVRDVDVGAPVERGL